MLNVVICDSEQDVGASSSEPNYRLRLHHVTDQRAYEKLKKKFKSVKIIGQKNSSDISGATYIKKGKQPHRHLLVKKEMIELIKTILSLIIMSIIGYGLSRLFKTKQQRDKARILVHRIFVLLMNRTSAEVLNKKKTFEYLLYKVF